MDKDKIFIYIITGICFAVVILWFIPMTWSLAVERSHIRNVCEDFELRIDELGHATCDQLTDAYSCCDEMSITVFDQEGCDNRYIPLMVKRC